MTIDVKKNILNYKKRVLEQFELVSVISQQNLEFKEFSIDLFEINTIDLSIFELKNVLYLFKISDWGKVKNGTELCDEILAMKADKSKPKLPKVNSDNGENILYIGKSTGNFKTRLRQHLGGYSPSTYSLQLSSWNDKLKTIKIELYYTQVDFSKLKAIDSSQNENLLELLETSLHIEYQPLLGRTGH